jgi:protoporphyrinogen IX oxidase
VVRPESTLYLSVLSLHIISIVAWMAGILYLMRLFVYHAEETESVVKARFKIMESRLYRFITLPAMVSSLVFGTLLLFIHPSFLKMGWLHLKLLFVLLLVGATHFCGSELGELAQDRVRYTSRTYRILNEVPTVILIAIVCLAVFKPF